MNLLHWLGFRSQSAYISREWLADQQRTEREPFEGVCIAWPIKKLLNDSPIWNKAKLKRTA